MYKKQHLRIVCSQAIQRYQKDFRVKLGVHIHITHWRAIYLFIFSKIFILPDTILFLIYTEAAICKRHTSIKEIPKLQTSEWIPYCSPEILSGCKKTEAGELIELLQETLTQNH